MSREEDLRNRVREVIVASGRKQADFALSINLDPPKLSKSLAGTRRFTPLELALIAEQGQRSVDWLLYGASKQPTLAARVQEADVSDVVQQACARAEELDEVHVTLAAAGCARQAAPALPSIRLRGRLLDQGAALAADALELVASSGVGSSEEQRDGLPEMIERVFGVNVGIEDWPPGFDGLSWCRNGFRLILVSNSGSWTRQQFTLAHELGHILAGDAQDLQVDIDVMSSTVRRGDNEMRANAFAASFLMPERDVKESSAAIDENSFARLVGHLGVSPSALSWRLLNLGLVGDEERTHLGMLTLRECAVRGGWLERYRARTRDQSEVRRPGLLSRDVLEAFEAGRVSARVAARVLEVQPETLLPPPLPAQLDDDVEGDLVFIP